MGRRLELQAMLENLVGAGVKVYFQPPESITMQYPCIVYSRDYNQVEFADNLPYRPMKRWSITVIDRDPDSEIPEKIESLQYCSFNRHFVADELNHDNYSLYF